MKKMTTSILVVLALLTGSILSCFAAADGYNRYDATLTLACSVESGTYQQDQSVTLTASDANASIRYALTEGDYADPLGTDSTSYTGPIAFSASNGYHIYYLTAIAERDGVYSEILYRQIEIIPTQTNLLLNHPEMIISRGGNDGDNGENITNYNVIVDKDTFYREIVNGQIKDCTNSYAVWISDGSPVVLGFDLGETKTMNRIVFQSSAFFGFLEGAYANLTVQYSDDNQNWKNAYVGVDMMPNVVSDVINVWVDGTSWPSCYFDLQVAPFTGRYVRFVSTSTDTTARGCSTVMLYEGDFSWTPAGGNQVTESVNVATTANGATARLIDYLPGYDYENDFLISQSTGNNVPLKTSEFMDHFLSGQMGVSGLYSSVIYWRPSGVNEGTKIEIDLGATYTLQHFEFQCRQDVNGCYAVDFTLETSPDGVHWTSSYHADLFWELEKDPTTGAPYGTGDFETPVTCRYLRISNSAADPNTGAPTNFSTACAFRIYTVAGEPIPDADVIQPVTQTITRSYGELHTLAELLSTLTEAYTTYDFVGKNGTVYSLPIKWTAGILTEEDATFGGDLHLYGAIDGALPTNVSDPYHAALNAIITLPATVDFRRLTAAYDAYVAANVNTALYTKASVAVLTEAATQAKTILDNKSSYTDQLVLDAAVTSLNTALSSLEKLGDLTALKATVARAKAIDASKYTANSVEAMKTILADVEGNISSNDLSQTAADQLNSRLAAALDALIEAGDKTALKQKIADCETLTADTYTPSTFTAMTEALATAKTVAADANADKAAVDAALDALTKAFNALKTKADMSALTVLLEKAKALDAAAYTITSYDAVSHAVADGDAMVAAAEADQATVDALVATLQAAVDALTRLGDKTALNRKLENAQAEKDSYTKASWEAYEKALSDIMAVANDAQADEAAVKAAEATLDTALAALEKKGDTAALAALIANAPDKSLYTALSYSDYEAAVTAARIILNAEEATVKQVADVTELVNSALAALQKLGDTAALTGKITEAEGLIGGSYASDLLAALNKALETAREVQNDSQASEQDVADALAGLETAMNAIKTAGEMSAAEETTATSGNTGKKGCKSSIALLTPICLLCAMGAGMKKRKENV